MRNPTFNETLLSGYLDGELTQAEAQKVRLRLEDDSETRALFEDLRKLRQASLGTVLPVPTDDQWREVPSGALSRALRHLGGTLVVVWLVATVGLAIWGLWRADEDWWVKAVVVAGLGGVVSWFASILIDRLRQLGGDRYRRVQR